MVNAITIPMKVTQVLVALLEDEQKVGCGVFLMSMYYIILDPYLPGFWLL